MPGRAEKICGKGIASTCLPMFGCPDESKPCFGLCFSGSELAPVRSAALLRFLNNWTDSDASHAVLVFAKIVTVS